MRKNVRAGGALALVVMVAVVTAGARGAPAAPTPVPGAGTCALAVPASDPEPPEYYAFPLVTTRRIPEARMAEGTGEVTFAGSPFGVAVAEDGSYRYELHLGVEKLREPARGTWVVWVTTPEVDRIERIGTLGNDGTARGRVAWNKFLVVITLEESDDPDAATWSGPIALRGMSRSGKMHTMAGHGPFQQENCAAYGYGN